MKYINYIMMVLILAAFVAAERFQPNDLIDLQVYCVNDGTPCTAGNCTITVYTDDNRIMINQKEMSSDGNLFNYTIPDGLPQGSYKFISSCCESGDCNTEEDEFEISTAATGLFLFLVGGVTLIFLLIALYAKNAIPYMISGVMCIGFGLMLWTSSILFGMCFLLLGIYMGFKTFM